MSLFQYIAQACQSLAATAAPSITAMGIHIVLALATIMMVWFGVQEALLARRSLVGAHFQGVDALLIGDFVIQVGRARGECERAKDQNQGRFYRRPHGEPPQTAGIRR